MDTSSIQTTRAFARDTTRVAFVMTGELHRNSRAIKQLRSLAGAGYQVEVWHLSGKTSAVAFPPTVEVHDLLRPTGRGPSFFKQLDQAFSAALADAEADIFHASDLYALPACRRRADQTGNRLSYDAREYYPHVAGTVGKPWARWWWRHLERKHISRADVVFTVSDSIADALAADYPIERPLVVHNAPLRDQQEAIEDISTLADRIGTNGPIILHLGQMKAHRGCESLIQALSFLEDGELVFLGYGPMRDALEKLRDKAGLTARVHFLDPVAPDAIRSAIRDATVGVTMLEDTCLNHRFALPNKLFDYIHAGIPVLGADSIEVKRVVESFGIGHTAPADDPAAIAGALRLLLEPADKINWRANLSRAAETFAWESASQRFLNGFAAMMDASTGNVPDRNAG